ncbi:SOS response-associated peptidase [Aureimonas sp. SA4125]|uniref:SOS response-associated peptidase n=1 Tax=Aureimonas sp. SA4125 TaxID=2826993 RepID=UPI001CC6FB65|nr:SOS response-associated peptidase [Aureimonas sp. SA4125]
MTVIGLPPLIAAMCSRFTLTASPAETAALLGLGCVEPFPPRYNIAPAQPILVCLGGAEDRPDAGRPGRTSLLVRWGLIPGWVKDLKGFPLLFNATAEMAAEKNAFRAALRYRRCLVPASGWYEWSRDGRGRKKQAFFMKPRTVGPIAFAGLMETWLSPDGSEIDTAAILTTAASAALAPVRDRMPVVLDPADFARWLDCRTYDADGVDDLLRPAPDRLIEAVPVSDRVNRIADTSPEIQAPLAPAPPPGDKTRDHPDQASLF